MDNQQHSATSNAIVEKVSIPSPLELNMSVGTNTDIRNNNPTPTGLTQYNGYSWWQGKYNYLYSGNSSYEYYQNNTSDVSEYCKLMKGNGLFIHNWLSCQGISDNSDNHKYFWFRSPRLSDAFAVTSSAYGNLGLNYASLTEKSRTAALFSF